MTIADLQQFPAGVAAAVATLVAALVAAMTVILSAAIGARTAKVVARDNFRRQVLFENLKPFLVRLDARIAMYHRLIDAGPFITQELHGIAKATDQDRASKVEFVLAMLRELPGELAGLQELWRSTSSMSLLVRDQRLIDLAASWLRTTTDFMALVEGNPFGVTSAPARIAEMKQAASKALWGAVELRVALEESVIQPAGWVTRRMYDSRQVLQKGLKNLRFWRAGWA